LGRALLEHAEVAAREAGFDSIYLYTHERMAENLALYSRIGYSTAVRDLAAKPVLDVQIPVASFDPLEAFKSPLEALGLLLPRR
jgi:hypothetical protein